MAKFRIEKDSLGTKKIPGSAYYGINGVRALENFPITGLKNHTRFIDAFMIVKKAAALVNSSLGLIDDKVAKAIARAADEVLKGKFRDQFVVDIFQMGAGTALHMNVNEVLANRAEEILGGKKGQYKKVHPNDHVNYGQSTNDVFPTAIRIGIRRYLNELVVVCSALSKTFLKKGKEFDNIVKSARTHLQDAVPIRLGQEFTAYGITVQKATDRLKVAATEIEELGIGGTAAGTGLNSSPSYAKKMVDQISKDTKISFRIAKDLREAMQSQRPLAEVSSALKNLSLELSRICSDLRLMSSGPTTGLFEISLPPVQAGSSIMPGKVNPSMAEMLNMICYQVVGNDTALSYGIQAGQLELNVMMPMMAFNLMFSVEILKHGIQVFNNRCVVGIKANKENCKRYAEMSMSLVTVLNPIIGYAKAAKLVKDSLRTKRTIIQTIKDNKILSDKKLKKILNLKKLTEPGVHK